MSEIDYDFNDDDTDVEPKQNPLRAQLKRYEKENADLRKQVQQSVEAQKKLAFVEAGVPLDSPMAKYFIKGYDGDLTPEAIREAAMEAQLIAPVQETVAEDDKKAWRETNRIAAGADSVPAPPTWQKRIADAASEAEIMSIFAEAQAQGIDLSEI